MVLVGRLPAHADITTVDVDNVHGASMAVLHLAKLGYTRIATITGPANMVAALDRREGFLRGMRAMGIEIPAGYMQTGDWSEWSGTQAMERLLRLSPRPDAVFVASDNMAIGALKAMRSAGLRVPEDVALVGFDDIPLAATTEPPADDRASTHRSVGLPGGLDPDRSSTGRTSGWNQPRRAAHRAADRTGRSSVVRPVASSCRQSCCHASTWPVKEVSDIFRHNVCIQTRRIRSLCVQTPYQFP